MTWLKPAAIASCLALAACGGNDGNLSATAGNQGAPLTQIPAPNGDWTQTVTQTPEGGYRMGNPDAPVKLVEYASITCPHCAEFAAGGTEPLTSQYVRSGQVSWEYRPYMLFPSDPGVFMLLRCQGPTPFFRLVEQLYATQPEWAGRLQSLPTQEQERIRALPAASQPPLWVRASGVDQFFRQRGMPEARINSCLADGSNLEALAQVTRRGTENDGVTGTPTFFINGERQDVADWHALEPLLRAAIGG